MSDSLIDIDALSDAVEQALEEYTTEIEREIPKVIERDAKAALTALRGASPVKTGKYAKGWSIRKITRDDSVSYVIYNRTDYQITHLLELGHANRNGGRTAAIPHIAPVAEEYGAKLTEDLRAVVGGGHA